MIELVDANPQHAELLHDWVNEPLSLKYNPINATSSEAIRNRLAHMGASFKDDFNEYGWLISGTREPSS